MCGEGTSRLDGKSSSSRDVGQLVFLDSLALVGDGESLTVMIGSDICAPSKDSE